jgi:single-stranded-DNA-specific exonuclease
MELTTNQKPAVYCIDENEWNGKVSIQLRLKNIK